VFDAARSRSALSVLARGLGVSNPDSRSVDEKRDEANREEHEEGIGGTDREDAIASENPGQISQRDPVVAHGVHQE
jgi:hypothetical protein